MSDLRSRAEKYLRGPRIISEPGATFAKLVARYVAGETWDDPGLRDLLSRCLIAARSEAAAHEDLAPGPARDVWYFYHQSAALLDGIQAEVSGGGV